MPDLILGDVASHRARHELGALQDQVSQLRASRRGSPWPLVDPATEMWRRGPAMCDAQDQIGVCWSTSSVDDTSASPAAMTRWA